MASLLRWNSEFGKESMQFLSHMINSQGIMPVPTEGAPIRSYPFPEPQKKLRPLLGPINYYGKFIPNCAIILQTLTDTLRGHTRKFHLSIEAI